MSSAIDRVVDFIAERDPDFPSHIRGASPDEINDLEHAVGRPLPPAYRRFLARMGHGLDWLDLGNASFDIDAITRHYQAAGGVADPVEYFLIGRAKGDPYYDIYLRSSSPEESRIATFPQPPMQGFESWALTHVRPMAGSLPQFLAVAALRVFRLHRLPLHKQAYTRSIDPGLLMQLDAPLTAQALPPLWFSNDWVRVYENKNALAIAAEFPRCPLVVDLHAETEESLKRHQAAISNLLRAR